MNSENESGDGLDRTHFRELLLQRRSVLQRATETGGEAAETVELDQSRVGRLSRMDALQGQAMSQEAQRRREQELLRIGQALKRVAAEEYGDCLRCGEEIAAGRLQIDPAATLCIQCANSV